MVNLNEILKHPALANVIEGGASKIPIYISALAISIKASLISIFVVYKRFK